MSRQQPLKNALKLTCDGAEQQPLLFALPFALEQTKRNSKFSLANQGLRKVQQKRANYLRRPIVSTR